MGYVPKYRRISIAKMGGYAYRLLADPRYNGSYRSRVAEAGPCCLSLPVRRCRGEAGKEPADAAHAYPPCSPLAATSDRFELFPSFPKLHLFLYA